MLTPRLSLRRIGTVIGQYAPARAEQLNRYAWIRTLERLRQLFLSAGFEDVAAKSTTKSVSFASFDDYFGGTEAGARISAPEFVKLPVDTRAVVREAVRAILPRCRESVAIRRRDGSPGRIRPPRR